MSQTPYRYIKIPSPVTFVHPVTKAPVEPAETCSFMELVLKVMENPKWKVSYDDMMAARNILVALDTAMNTKSETMVLLESDWARLEEAVRNPRQFIMNKITGTKVEPGFGYHPLVASQILPLCDAVIGASKEPPQKMAPSEPIPAQA